MKVVDGLHAFIWDSMTVNNCNTYLIDGPVRVLIDPGHERYFDHVGENLAALGLTVGDMDLIICTHCHPDHIEGVARFKTERARVAMHETEWRFLSAMTDRLISAMGIDLETVSPDDFLSEGPLNLRGFSLDVFHTPGHSPGSICLYWPEKKALVTGDLIFAEGLGRIDLPGGSASQIKESILRMKALDVRWLLPGHGEILVGEAAVRNAFAELESVWFQYIG